ncbi:MAG: hypothetical protein ACE5F1_20510, partial [Planctomycetota bacterium]
MMCRPRTEHGACAPWIRCGFLTLLPTAACGSLISSRVGPEQGCKVEYLQAGDRLLRLTMVNRSFAAQAAGRGEVVSMGWKQRL